MVSKATKTKAALSVVAGFAAIQADVLVNKDLLDSNRIVNDQVSMSTTGSFESLSSEQMLPTNLVDLHSSQIHNVINSIPSSILSIPNSISENFHSIGLYAKDAFESVKDLSLSVWGNGAEQLVSSAIDSISSIQDNVVETISSDPRTAIAAVTAAVVIAASVGLYKIASNTVEQRLKDNDGLANNSEKDMVGESIPNSENELKPTPSPQMR